MALQKACRKCNGLKDIDQFTKNAAMSDGKSLYCKDCDYWMRKDLRDKNPEAYSSRHLKSRYGITLEQKKEMFREQEGKCFTCSSLFTSISKAYVDHNHKSFKVRRLLCRDCNTALGLIKENFDVALNLAKYIQEDQGVI